MKFNQKVYHFLPIVIMFITISLTAQTKYGLKGSLQFTNITNVHEYSRTRMFAPAIGGFAQIPMNDLDDRFFFNVEVILSSQGEKSKSVYKNEEITEFYQTYINIPLMFKYYIPDNIFFSRRTCDCSRRYDDHEFFVGIGPQFGIPIQQKNKEIDDKVSGGYGGLRAWDLSIGAEVGLSFQRKYEFSVRYNYGVVDAYPNYMEGYNKHSYTSILAFTFAYLFDRR